MAVINLWSLQRAKSLPFTYAVCERVRELAGERVAGLILDCSAQMALDPIAVAKEYLQLEEARLNLPALPDRPPRTSIGCLEQELSEPSAPGSHRSKRSRRAPS